MAIPSALRTEANREVLAFLDGKSSHSDNAAALLDAAKPLGDVQVGTSDSDYGHLVLSTVGVVFAASWGMREVGFRLDEATKRRALEVGARDAPEVGPSWVAIQPFRADYPDPDLEFWARTAYRLVRDPLAR